MSDPHTALAAIGLLPDAEIDIADAALQLARIDAPEADWQAARLHLSELAREAAWLALDVAVDDLSGQAGVLAGLLAGRCLYRGDRETYNNPANANLIRVIERRRGLPVALGILWLHTARAAGWTAHGVDFPGHFLVALTGHGAQTLLDVFAGGTPLEARDLRALVKQMEGPTAELRPGALAPMGPRAVLLRLQNNIRQRRLRAGNVAGALAIGETMLLIAPNEAGLWRETAEMHRALDQVGAALRCLERFVELVPAGEAATLARAVMDELRSRLN
jgi:regulator of sirC expression with transglutaminase-like and TPR domain